MMRTLTLIALSLSFAGAFSSAALANDCLGTSGKLSVKGYAEVKAEPDVVNLNFTISAVKNKSVEARMIAFAKALDDLKDESLEIISENISLSPQYTYKDNANVFAGYKANRAVTVKTSNFAAISKITELATQSGVDIIESFIYGIKDPKALQIKADELAIQDAKDKAERLSKGFNVKIVKTCSLHFADMSERPMMRAMSANKALVSEGFPYSPQDQTVSSTVMAEFLIE